MYICLLNSACRYQHDYGSMSIVMCWRFGWSCITTGSLKLKLCQRASKILYNIVHLKFLGSHASGLLDPIFSLLSFSTYIQYQRKWPILLDFPRSGLGTGYGITLWRTKVCLILAGSAGLSPRAYVESWSHLNTGWGYSNYIYIASHPPCREGDYNLLLEHQSR